MIIEMENIDKINFLGIYAKHIHYMLNRIHCEQNMFRGQIHELLDSSVSFVACVQCCPIVPSVVS